jgi:type VI protein secretion system component VasF
MTLLMKPMPSPDRAERNQQRKLAFIPVWPIIGAIVVVAALVWLAH